MTETSSKHIESEVSETAHGDCKKSVKCDKKNVGTTEREDEPFIKVALYLCHKLDIPVVDDGEVESLVMLMKPIFSCYESTRCKLQNRCWISSTSRRLVIVFLF